MRKLTSILFILLASWTVCRAQVKKKMHYQSKVVIKVPEPSDICLSPDKNTMFIVSDKGMVFQTDLKGKVIKASSVLGTDFEGVYADSAFVYVADETARLVYKLDQQTLEKVGVYEVPYSGARNSGVESLTYNEARKRFVMITEKNPILIFELDGDFKKVNREKFTASRDISAATYHDGFLWLLGDEDRTVFKLDANNYQVLESILINVPNPEGIAFDKEGKMIICGDDTTTLYYFNKP